MSVEPEVPADLVARLRARLASGGGPPGPAEVTQAVRAEAGLVGDADLLAVAAGAHAELVGLGRLAPLVADPSVSDVVVNGPDQVWVDDGAGLRPAPVRFRDDAEVRRLAVRLAALAGRRLDPAAPFVDARLPGGVRLHAAVPPVSPAGTLVSLRLARHVRLGIDDLERLGSVAPAAAAMLRSVVRERSSFLVTGGTGTGKTTVLSALLGLVPPAERIVLVEEVGELLPAHPHVVRLEARPPNVEGVGEVTVRTLVRQALRMRPDRLVVGEARGAEVVDLLAALNTGHEGGAATVHANAAADLPSRVEALASMGGLGVAAARAQLLAAVAVVVHLVRSPTGRRRVAEIAGLVRGEGPGDPPVLVVPALVVDAGGRVVHADPSALRRRADGWPP